MLKHIVMWEIKEDIIDKKKVALNIKEHLEKLPDKISELKSAKVIIDLLDTSTFDIVLIAETLNEDTLKAYSNNEKHVEIVKKYILPCTKNRCCIDYFE